MSGKIDIPDEEINQFQPFLRVFESGKIIVREGELDQTLYLLRHGTVEISRDIAGNHQVLDAIHAINFFGEMSFFTNHPRAATVTAKSSPVVVYAFDRPNVRSILSNERWGPMLVRRIADDLEERLDDYDKALTSLEDQRRAQCEFISNLLNILQMTAEDTAMQMLVLKSLPELLKAQLCDLKLAAQTIDMEKIELYHRQGIIHDDLYTYLRFQHARLLRENS